MRSPAAAAVVVVAVVATALVATAAAAQQPEPAPAPPAPPPPEAPAAPPEATATPATTTTPAAAEPAAPTPEPAPATAPAPALVPAPATKPAAVDEAPGKIKVIVLDLKAASLQPGEAAAISNLVTVSLSEFSALEVVSGADVREMLALEGEKQQLGCEESMSCLAEIAGALGARIVAYGQVEKLGSRYLMSLSLQDTKANKSVGRMALQGDGLDAVAAAIPDEVHKMTAAFLTSEGRSTASSSARATAPKLATEPASDHGTAKWTGGIIAGVSFALLSGMYAGGLLLAENSAAPGEAAQSLKIPVAGPFLLANALIAKTNGKPSSGGTGPVATDPGGSGATSGAVFRRGPDDGDLSGPIIASFAAGIAESLLAVGAVAGGATWAGGVMADGPELGGAGNAWRFGLMGGGALLVAGGAAFDLSSSSSSDRKLDAADFVGPSLEVAGVAAAGVGLLTNPFPLEENAE